MTLAGWLVRKNSASCFTSCLQDERESGCWPGVLILVTEIIVLISKRRCAISRDSIKECVSSQK